MGELKIACVGDTMCGDSFSQIGFGVASSLDKHGRDFMSKDITDILSKHHLVLCNIECVLSDVGRKDNSLRTLHMRGRPEVANYLADWGITVAHVANNHILEQGLEAAQDTVKQLEKAGVRVVGSGRDGLFQRGVRAEKIDLGDHLVAIVGVCFRDEKYAFYNDDIDEVLAIIEAEASGERLVIVSVHWGDELIAQPSIWQRDIKKRFEKAGAGMIIGHHPHVVQGVDDSSDCFVAYSLGNFIFDSHSEITGWSVILSITVSGKRIVKWEPIPILRGDDYQPVFATGKRKESLERKMMRLCEICTQEIEDRDRFEKEYCRELRALDYEHRRQLWRSIATNFFRYRPVFWPQILMRPVQRRLNLW